MLGQGLYSFLAAAPTITALVGTPNNRADSTTGIFPLQMPEGTPLPALVIQEIAGTGIVTMDGASGLWTSRVQFDSYGKTLADAATLAKATRLLLEGMNATLPDGTEVDVASVLHRQDDFEFAPFIFRALLELDFWYREP